VGGLKFLNSSPKHSYVITVVSAEIVFVPITVKVVPSHLIAPKSKTVPSRTAPSISVSPAMFRVLVLNCIQGWIFAPIVGFCCGSPNK